MHVKRLRPARHVLGDATQRLVVAGARRHEGPGDLVQGRLWQLPTCEGQDFQSLLPLARSVASADRETPGHAVHFRQLVPHGRQNFQGFLPLPALVIRAQSCCVAGFVQCQSQALHVQQHVLRPHPLISRLKCLEQCVAADQIRCGFRFLHPNEDRQRSLPELGACACADQSATYEGIGPLRVVLHAPQQLQSRLPHALLLTSDDNRSMTSEVRLHGSSSHRRQQTNRSMPLPRAPANAHCSAEAHHVK
mmetsp:Transcript_110808/g.353053  ORF Transcript_110808/g.353053 Transcript_110808/m.353053 type:complete len:249 (-) Transcript_110808:1017-1763(-)